jgi:hypothetical protein
MTDPNDPSSPRPAHVYGVAFTQPGGRVTYHADKPRLS